MHRRVPLAAGLPLKGFLEGVIGQASHRRNLCPLCRPAPAGSRDGGGNGPVAGRLADAERALDTSFDVWASLHFKRKVRHVPDEATRRFRAARVRVASKRHATACRMRTPSGGNRVRAQVAPPRMSRLRRDMHTTPNFRTAQPVRGPPESDMCETRKRNASGGGFGVPGDGAGASRHGVAAKRCRAAPAATLATRSPPVAPVLQLQTTSGDCHEP